MTWDDFVSNGKGKKPPFVPKDWYEFYAYPGTNKTPPIEYDNRQRNQNMPNPVQITRIGEYPKDGKRDS